MKTLDQWMRSGEYLPPFMRDFHDQKEVFKTIHETVDTGKHEYTRGVSWVTGHCYVIDIFLWFMAKRGWTLQRSRTQVEFRDLEADLEARRLNETRSFQTFLEERKNVLTPANEVREATSASPNDRTP